MEIVPFLFFGEIFQRREGVKGMALDSFEFAPVMEIEQDFSLRSK
jgi:hypothetical protein